MKQIINSPLKILGLLTILLGLIVSILTYGYLILLGLILIGVGLLVYFINYLTNRLLKSKKEFWIIQSVLTSAYLILAFVTYMKWQEHNLIVFPKDFKGQAGIIFGIEGYPELPKTEFWKKTIYFPDNGIIITSTREEDIPNSVKYSFKNNISVNYDRISWDPNFAIDCITCDSEIKSWLFSIDAKKSSIVKNAMTKLCDDILARKAKSFYKSDFSTISTDNKGKYLGLQNKGLTSLPNGLGKLDIYKAILTGNELTEIPPQILEITSLQDLILAVNPISEFPCNLNKLKRLKSVSFAETNIKVINCDLSVLDSLEDFDISGNALTSLPEQIKNIPNLKWLSLNDNHFTNLSFVDNRLNKIETLYLYSNKIKTISKETRYLSNVKELLIFDNEIDSIPNNISDFINLEELEIWDNPIKYISPNISKLTKLKSIRIDDDYLSKTDKLHLKKWLPKCIINYQTRNEKKNSQ